MESAFSCSMMAFLQRIRFSSGAWHLCTRSHRQPIRLGLQKYLIVMLCTIAKSASTDRDHQDDNNTHTKTPNTQTDTMRMRMRMNPCLWVPLLQPKLDTHTHTNTLYSSQTQTNVTRPSSIDKKTPSGSECIGEQQPKKKIDGGVDFRSSDCKAKASGRSTTSSTACTTTTKFDSDYRQRRGYHQVWLVHG